MLQFRVDLARFLGTTYSGENLGLTFLFPSFHDVTPTTWLTSGFYLVFIAAICILRRDSIWRIRPRVVHDQQFCSDAGTSR